MVGTWFRTCGIYVGHRTMGSWGFKVGFRVTRFCCLKIGVD